MSRLRPRGSNRFQIFAFAMLTLILAILAVFVGSVWFNEPKIVRIAAGPPDSVYHRFATKLAVAVRNNSRNLRISIVPTENSGDGQALLSRAEADLVILRTDAKIPPIARAMAILEHDVVFVITSKAQKVGSIAALRGRRVGLVDGHPQNENFVRRVLEVFDAGGSQFNPRPIPPDALAERLSAPNGPQALVAVTSISRLAAISAREGFLRRSSALEISGIDDGKAIERRIPGVYVESIAPGMISTTPKWPAAEIETIGLQHMLLARNRLAAPVVSELMRIIFENKQELQLEGEFATRIETPDMEKTVQIVAHQGAADYVNGDTKSLVDRYSDLFYLGTTVAGIFGSIFLGLYSWVTKVEPAKASVLAREIFEIVPRIKSASSERDLELADTELEDILRQALMGLHDGTLSSEGLDVFRMAHDNAHRMLLVRRHELSQLISPKETKITNSALVKDLPASEVRENNVKSE